MNLKDLLLLADVNGEFVADTLVEPLMKLMLMKKVMRRKWAMKWWARDLQPISIPVDIVIDASLHSNEPRGSR
jgi:hypothetical protein